MTRKVLLMTVLLCTPALWSELETVPHVDIDRYLGTWEEIARFPNKYQEGCVNSTAEYTQAKGYIKVKNTCTTVDGKNKDATGRTKITDAANSAKLQVNFTPFFIRIFGVGWGNYWIIELDSNYEYAVVSEPKMESLWILARNKPMKKAIYDGIVQRLKTKGFSTEKLIVASNAISDN